MKSEPQGCKELLSPSRVLGEQTGLVWSQVSGRLLRPFAGWGTLKEDSQQRIHPAPSVQSRKECGEFTVVKQEAGDRDFTLWAILRIGDLNTEVTGSH